MYAKTPSVYAPGSGRMPLFFALSGRGRRPNEKQATLSFVCWGSYEPGPIARVGESLSKAPPRPRAPIEKDGADCFAKANVGLRLGPGLSLSRFLCGTLDAIENEGACMKIDLRTNVAGAAPIAEGSAARKVAGAIDRSSFARSGATGGFGRSGAALVDGFSAALCSSVFAASSSSASMARI